MSKILTGFFELQKKNNKRYSITYDQEKLFEKTGYYDAASYTDKELRGNPFKEPLFEIKEANYPTKSSIKIKWHTFTNKV